MTAIATTPESIDFDDLFDQLTRNLPSYAVPLFIRFVDHIDKTGENRRILKIKYLHNQHPQIKHFRNSKNAKIKVPF